MDRKYSTDQDNYIDFNGSKPATAQAKAQPNKYTDLDFLFHEIEVLLTTSPCDKFIDFCSYVFETHISASTLQSKIMGMINRSVCIPDGLMVEVSFMRGDVSDIGLIDVTITKNNDCTTKPECQRRVFIFV